MSKNSPKFEIYDLWSNGFAQPWCHSNKPFLGRSESQLYYGPLSSMCMVCGKYHDSNTHVVRDELPWHYFHGVYICIFHCRSIECLNAVKELFLNDFMYADGRLPKNTPLKIIMSDLKEKENFYLLPVPFEFNGKRSVIVRNEYYSSSIIVSLDDLVSWNQDKVIYQNT